jgi:hypothetical protein
VCIILRRFSVVATKDIHSILSFVHMQLAARLSDDVGLNIIRVLKRRGGGGLPPQTGPVTVEVVPVPGNRTRTGVLPESVIAPSVGQSADGASIASNPQRVVSDQRNPIASASCPPTGSGAYHWGTKIKFGKSSSMRTFQGILVATMNSAHVRMQRRGSGFGVNRKLWNGHENMQQTAKNIRIRAGASENSDENTRPEESETGGDDTRGTSRSAASSQWMMPAPAVHLLVVGNIP